MKYEWSGILLITASDEVIAMQRDDTPTIRDPGCIGIFGGRAEGGENPIEAALRELKEETNLSPKAEDLELFKVYEQERDDAPTTATLSVFTLKNVDPDTLKTYEGNGIRILKDADNPKIAKDVKDAFVDWFALHQK